MSAIKKIIFLLLVSAAFAACKSDNVESTADKVQRFKGYTQPGAYPDGSPSLQLDLDLHQVSINTTGTLIKYRIQNDAQTVLLNCKLSEAPQSIGQEITVGVDSKGVVNVPSRVYKVRVVAISGNYCWLWSDEDTKGFIVAFQI